MTIVMSHSLIALFSASETLIKCDNIWMLRSGGQ